MWYSLMKEKYSNNDIRISVEFLESGKLLNDSSTEIHRYTLDLDVPQELTCDAFLGAIYAGIRSILTERYHLGVLENQSAVKAGKGESGKSSFWKMAILNRESLAVIYPILKKKPYLFPFYPVKRWYRIFNPQKRKKVQKIASSVSAVSEEKKDLTARFLTDLGLIKK